MPVLPGGDVVPSFMAVEASKPHYDGHNFDNTELRLGEVQDIIYPDDKRSRTKKFVEYRVLVQQRSNRTGCAKIYENCTMANPLGGLADYLNFTLRADHSQNQSKDGLGKGSKVLILCINGEQNTAIIVGGVRDQSDQRSIKDKDLKHHLDFQFNGVGVNINNDGEFTLTFNGATNIKGQVLAKTDQKPIKDFYGTSLKIDKFGALRVAAGLNLEGDASQTFTIDPQNDKIQIQAHKDFFIRSRARINMVARDGNLVAQSEKADVKVLAKGGVQVKGSQTGVALGDGGQALVLGNRQSDDLRSLLQTLATQLAILGVKLTSGNTGGPVGGADSCVQMVTAIGQYIGKMQQHLSRNNSTD